MVISYKWLSEYLPEVIDTDRLAKILTAVGLEVEAIEAYEAIKGSLQGLFVGEVLACEQHPNADKLKLTKVTIGSGEPLQIVCGAPNVAVGQKVIVATIGTTIYPTSGEPMTMKAAKIRGVESQGMICAEDEIGLGDSHAGIMILPNDVVVGTPAAAYFNPYHDTILEIGLTPNRMDAMSHLGVAKDVCAYLTHHDKKECKPKTPFTNGFKVDNNNLPITVTVENTEACPRYSGVSISGVTVKESPQWLKDKLIAIGQRPINNIVDITNYVLHETGQPLHAFDAAAITGNTIVVKNLPQDSSFITLDGKERKLHAEDLMICNGEAGMCIAGVFGGAESGVSSNTTAIFLESACFNATNIRKTSVRHGLRTDAATRFEKGTDIAATVQVLKRAALLIKDIAGGTISSDIIDIYPVVKQKAEVALKYHYLKKLSGKNYHPDAVKKIVEALGFDILKEGIDELRIAVPFSKPDISIPADIVEEIIRIDGLDNIEIPEAITITPANDTNTLKEALKEKIAVLLTGMGFQEMLTNSITNSKYFTEAELNSTVKMMNNLSAELDVLRPSMLQTGLETISYNINRKNNFLQLFEFGKTYHTQGVGQYNEAEHLCLYLTGKTGEDCWRLKARTIDLYTAKGFANAILNSCGISLPFELSEGNGLTLTATVKKDILVSISDIDKKQLSSFDIKQPVYFVDINWPLLVSLVAEKKISYKEVSKYPSVQRDIAMVVDKKITYAAIEETVKKAKVNRLKDMRLFDVFVSEKIGANNQSLAVSFTFADEEKTLTDKEIDGMMGKLTTLFEKELGATLRK